MDLLRIGTRVSPKWWVALGSLVIKVVDGARKCFPTLRISQCGSLACDSHLEGYRVNLVMTLTRRLCSIIAGFCVTVCTGYWMALWHCGMCGCVRSSPESRSDSSNEFLGLLWDGRRMTSAPHHRSQLQVGAYVSTHFLGRRTRHKGPYGMLSMSNVDSTLTKRHPPNCPCQDLPW